jgi:hypothetical protein
MHPEAGESLGRWMAWIDMEKASDIQFDEAMKRWAAGEEPPSEPCTPGWPEKPS